MHTSDAEAVKKEGGRGRVVVLKEQKTKERGNYFTGEMVQVISASTLTTSGSNSWCGSTHLLGKHLRLTKQIRGIFGVGSPCLSYQGAQRLPFVGPSDLSRDRNLRVEAGWNFRGRDQGSDARSELSESANEDLLIFFFQLDLATQVQVGMLIQRLPFIITLFTRTNNPSIIPSTPMEVLFSIFLCLCWQRALNLEDYDYAQHLRNKLTEVRLSNA